MPSNLSPVVLVDHTGPINRGAVIIFHGSGDTGDGLKKAFFQDANNFRFPHLQVIFPTAPKRPYTMLDNQMSHVWFDRESLDLDAFEHSESIDAACEQVLAFLKSDICSSIPTNKIVLGGFSMGGALALHVALRYLPNVAGVFALSSFLSSTSSVYKALQTNEKNPPVALHHGKCDDLVPIEWGNETYEMFTLLGADTTFTEYKSKHEITTIELSELYNWIYTILPNE